MMVDVVVFRLLDIETPSTLPTIGSLQWWQARETSSANVDTPQSGQSTRSLWVPTAANTTSRSGLLLSESREPTIQGS